MAQGVFEQQLFACVDGEADGGAGAGLGVVRHADGAAFFVADDGLDAFGPAEQIVHGGFDAGDAFFAADVVGEPAFVVFLDVAFFPLLEVAEHMAGEGAERVFALGAECEVDAGELDVVFGEFGKLFEAEVGAVAERHKAAVRDEMRAECRGVVVACEVEFAELGDGGFVDDRDDVFFLFLGGGFSGGGFFLRAFFGEVGLLDFGEVE